MPKIRGLTFIEVLIVVVIVGLLASLTIFMISQAQRQSRDARRKSDLVAISLAFQARYDDKTCQDLQVYPGVRKPDPSPTGTWWWLANLQGYADQDGSCPFSQYLKVLPADPSNRNLNPNSSDPGYPFNLAKLPYRGSHYRLAARLERSSQEPSERARMGETWRNSFGGAPFDLISSSRGYNYFIGN